MKTHELHWSNKKDETWLWLEQAAWLLCCKTKREIGEKEAKWCEAEFTHWFIFYIQNLEMFTLMRFIYSIVVAQELILCWL